MPVSYAVVNVPAAVAAMFDTLCIGMMTNIALANQHKVIAFEPVEKNFKLICATANKNHWNNNLILYQGC